MRFWAECGDFIRESRRHFHDTGALLPSSRFLAHALASELRKRRNPCRILEVGPGTGSVTRHILRNLLPSDQLDLVELNSHFITVLEQRFDREWRFWQHRDQVKVIHAAVQDLAGEGTYDYIISGLPLNNFGVSLVREIYQCYSRLLKPGGTLSYYEYVLIRQLQTPFVPRDERRRLYQVGRVVGKYIRTYQVRKQRIFMNVPPAVVRHLRFKPDAETSASLGERREQLVRPGRAH